MVHWCGRDGRSRLAKLRSVQNYDDEETRLVRFAEQRKAALIGEYAAQILLDIPSKTIKDTSRPEPVEDILARLCPRNHF